MEFDCKITAKISIFLHTVLRGPALLWFAEKRCNSRYKYNQIRDSLEKACSCLGIAESFGQRRVQRVVPSKHASFSQLRTELLIQWVVSKMVIGK